MGSGETAPTMVKTHRALFDRVGEAPAVLLSTPYGFQENASEIAARAVEYFRQSVGRSIEPVDEHQLARLRAAGLIFSGPGSPSYALRAWSGTPVPDLLADRLRPGGDGGCITFASAAALTLGLKTVPVYEIYKVGEEVRWLDGLDLLAAATGLRAAVIPHFDNAEGGTHDTRYCYLGERRLRMLEEQLPDDAFVLGVDEHTACILDPDAGTVEITGLGGVTVRRRGAAVRFEAGTTMPIARLQDADASPASTGQVSEDPPSPGRSPLLDDVVRLEAAFDDGDAGADAVLELEQLLHDWSGDTLQSDEPDRARAVLRSLIDRLGRRDDAARLAAVVAAVVAARDEARRERRWDEADRLRDALLAAGVEIRDEAGGTVWRSC